MFVHHVPLYSIGFHSLYQGKEEMLQFNYNLKKKNKFILIQIVF